MPSSNCVSAIKLTHMHIYYMYVLYANVFFNVDMCVVGFHFPHLSEKRDISYQSISCMYLLLNVRMELAHAFDSTLNHIYYILNNFVRVSFNVVPLFVLYRICCGLIGCLVIPVI